MEVSGKILKKLKGLEEYSHLSKEELSEAVTELVQELLEEYISESDSSEDDELFSENGKREDEAHE